MWYLLEPFIQQHFIYNSRSSIRVGVLTFVLVKELPARHSSIPGVPVPSITDSSPHSIAAHLHPPLCPLPSSSQTDVSLRTWWVYRYYKRQVATTYVSWSWYNELAQSLINTLTFHYTCRRKLESNDFNKIISHTSNNFPLAANSSNVRCSTSGCYGMPAVEQLWLVPIASERSDVWTRRTMLSKVCIIEWASICAILTVTIECELCAHLELHLAKLMKICAIIYTVSI